ncbi:MAG TPA: maleylacetate reductase, partial [Cytophagales bacterium]|nr:maleylacetate reductase [Cytophagales bacterium]
LTQLAQEDTLSMRTNEQIQLGAFLAGKCLCEVPMALHHKAAHVLGGTFNLEHSHVHTVLQAYVLEYQWPHLSQEVQQDFQAALAHDYPPQALQELAKANGAPYTLAAIGFGEADIDKAVTQMLAKPYPNPTPLTEEGLKEMLRKAVVGTLREF